MIIYAKLQSSRIRHQYGIFGGKSQTSFTRLGPGAKKDGCFRRLGLGQMWSFFSQQGRENFNLWVQERQITTKSQINLNIELKGEGHSKKRIFFVITNKKFMLS